MSNIFLSRLKTVKLLPKGIFKAAAGRGKGEDLLPRQTSMGPENVVFDVSVAEFQRDMNMWYSISPQNVRGCNFLYW